MYLDVCLLWGIIHNRYMNIYCIYKSIHGEKGNENENRMEKELEKEKNSNSLSVINLFSSPSPSVFHSR